MMSGVNGTRTAEGFSRNLSTRAFFVICRVFRPLPPRERIWRMAGITSVTQSQTGLPFRQGGRLLLQLADDAVIDPVDLFGAVGPHEHAVVL